MPKRSKSQFAPPVPVQLPLFAEAASLIRVRPEHNEWRFYRMKVWPDLFARALLLRGAVSAPKAAAGWIRIPTRALPSMLSPASLDAFAANHEALSRVCIPGRSFYAECTR